MNKSLLRKNKKGFTLIELVVVIAILGILAAILIPVIGGFISRANIAKDQANARSLFNSTAMYLATGGKITDQALAVIPDAAKTEITKLFGTIDSTAQVAVTGNVVVKAKYGTQTYNGDGTFSS